jgi:hypothetical protein
VSFQSHDDDLLAPVVTIFATVKSTARSVHAVIWIPNEICAEIASTNLERDSCIRPARSGLRGPGQDCTDGSSTGLVGGQRFPFVGVDVGEPRSGAISSRDGAIAP